jgi:hypothetical protein
MSTCSIRKAACMTYTLRAAWCSIRYRGRRPELFSLAQHAGGQQHESVHPQITSLIKLHGGLFDLTALHANASAGACQRSSTACHTHAPRRPRRKWPAAPARWPASPRWTPQRRRPRSAAHCPPAACRRSPAGAPLCPCWACTACGPPCSTHRCGMR